MSRVPRRNRSVMESRVLVRGLCGLLLLTLALVGDPSRTFGEREEVTWDARAELHSGRLLVKLAPGVTAESIAMFRDTSVRSVRRALAPAAHSDLESRFGLDRWMVVDLDPALDLQDAAREWRARADVEEVLPDYESTLDGTPADPLFVLQWGHQNDGQMLDYCDGCGGHDGGAPVGTPGFDAHVDDSWDVAGFGSGVVVAMVDTGVDIDHPDLVFGPGRDLYDNDNTPQDTNGHGTMVAGIIGAVADNGIGVAGVAPECTLMPIRTGGGLSERSDGILWAVDHGADIVNMSWTFYYVTEHALLESALDYAAAAGVMMISSSGNRNETALWLPQSHADVVSVGAASPCGDRKRSSSVPGEVQSGYQPDPNGVTCDNEKWWGSGYGVNVQDAHNAMDLLSPIILPTTRFDGNYENWFGGTSCSAPFVSGVAALILGMHPTWTPAEVREALVSTAVDVVNVESGVGWDRYAGYGLVDALAAVSFDPAATAVPEVASRRGGSLDRVAPSPFREATRVEWSLPRAADVSLTVFDAAGRRVRQLESGTHPAGAHASTWDGRDDDGNAAAAGVYFVTLTTPDGRETRKIARTR